MAIRKLSADDRIDEIVDAAQILIVRNRTLALGMNQIAAEIDSSRALIYVYFESVSQIIDEVCRRHLMALTEALDGAGGRSDTVARASALGLAYLAYLMEHGPALHYILRDPERHGSLRLSRPLLRTLIRSAVKETRQRLQVEFREGLVLIELLSAIPDTLARQLRDGKIDTLVARETCDRLMSDLVADLRVVR